MEERRIFEGAIYDISVEWYAPSYSPDGVQVVRSKHAVPKFRINYIWMNVADGRDAIERALGIPTDPADD